MDRKEKLNEIAFSLFLIFFYLFITVASAGIVNIIYNIIKRLTN